MKYNINFNCGLGCTSLTSKGPPGYDLFTKKTSTLVLHLY